MRGTLIGFDFNAPHCGNSHTTARISPTATRVPRAQTARVFSTRFHSALRAFAFALLPPHCLLCGQDGATARDLCDACAADLIANVTACARCALPLAAAAAQCGECLHSAPPFDAAYVPFVYASPLDRLLMRFKFGRSLAAGRVLAEAWCARWADAPPPLPQVLVPVPLHTQRLRERGYNQVSATKHI